MASVGITSAITAGSGIVNLLKRRRRAYMSAAPSSAITIPFHLLRGSIIVARSFFGVDKARAEAEKGVDALRRRKSREE